MHRVQRRQRAGGLEDQAVLAAGPQDEISVFGPNLVARGDRPAAQRGDGGLERRFALFGLWAVGVPGLRAGGPEDVLGSFVMFARL